MYYVAVLDSNQLNILFCMCFVEGGDVESGGVEGGRWRCGGWKVEVWRVEVWKCGSVEVWRVKCGGWKCRCVSDIIGRQFLYIFTSFHMLYMYMLPS